MKLLPLGLALSLLTLCAACSDEASSADAGATPAGASEADEQRSAEDAGVDDESADPPANWNTVSTSSAPTLLGVYASTAKSNRGTTGALTLSYRNELGTYSCSLPSGIAKGQWGTCTPSLTGSETSSKFDYFFVGFSTSNNTDGLLVGNVKAVVGGTTYSTSTFYNDVNGEDVYLHGCGNGLVADGSCGAAWVDGDDALGYDCTVIKIPFSREKDGQGGRDTVCAE